MLKFVSKFAELAHFTDDYVAIDMAKVRKFEDGLKLSIRGNYGTPTLGALGMRVLKIRERKANLLLLAQGRCRGLLLHQGFKDKVAAIRAKGRVNHPKMGDTPRLLASQGRGHVSITNNLDI